MNNVNLNKYRFLSVEFSLLLLETAKAYSQTNYSQMAKERQEEAIKELERKKFEYLQALVNSIKSDDSQK